MPKKRRKVRRPVVEEVKYGPPPQQEVEKPSTVEICKNIEMYLRLLDRAHKRTDGSNLRFGP